MVWIKIIRPGRKNLLIGNHYFVTYVHPNSLDLYFQSTANMTDFLSFDALMVGDFNASGGSDLQGNLRMILITIPNVEHYLFMNLTDFINCNVFIFHTNAIASSVLDLIITNCVVNITSPEGLVTRPEGLVRPDKFHPLFIICPTSIFQKRHLF